VTDVKYPHLLGALMDAPNDAIDVGFVPIQQMTKLLVFGCNCAAAGEFVEAANERLQAIKPSQAASESSP
jgi:hypothetical protein